MAFTAAGAGQSLPVLGQAARSHRVEVRRLGQPRRQDGKGAALALETAVLLFILLQYSLRLRDAGRRDTTVQFVVYCAAVAFVTAVFLVILRLNT